MCDARPENPLAPIRHADHVTPWAAGGRTHEANGAGLCVTCHLVKEGPGWRHTVTEAGHSAGSNRANTIEITTPTGRGYTSTAPPILLSEPDRHGDRFVRGGASSLEAHVSTGLAS